MCVSVLAHACVCVSVYLCVWEREREKGGEERERECRCQNCLEASDARSQSSRRLWAPDTDAGNRTQVPWKNSSYNKALSHLSSLWFSVLLCFEKMLSKWKLEDLVFEWLDFYTKLNFLKIYLSYVYQLCAFLLTNTVQWYQYVNLFFCLPIIVWTIINKTSMNILIQDFEWTWSPIAVAEPFIYTF